MFDFDLREMVGLLPGTLYCRASDGRYLFCNRALAAVLGLKHTDEIIGKTPHDLLSKEVADQVVAADSLVFDHGIERSFEEINCDKDGNATYYLSKKAPLHNKDGKVTAILGVSLDITEQKKQSQAAEAACSVREKFLSLVGCKLRDPLNAVYGIAQVLEIEDHTPRQRELLNHMFTSCSQLETVSDQLIDFTHLLSGDVNVEREKVHLGRLLSETASKYAKLAKLKGIQLKLSPPHESNPYIETDAGMLRRLVQVFLSNAIKFTQSGYVDITVASDANGKANITVTDTGVGIALEKLDAINHFFSESQERHYEAGLGFGIAKILAEKNSIEIKACPPQTDSPQEKGARFNLSFPSATMA